MNVDYIKDNVLFTFNTRAEHDYLVNLLVRCGLPVAAGVLMVSRSNLSDTWNRYPLGGTTAPVIGIVWWDGIEWFGYTSASTKGTRIAVSDLREKLNA